MNENLPPPPKAEMHPTLADTPGPLRTIATIIDNAVADRVELLAIIREQQRLLELVVGSLPLSVSDAIAAVDQKAEDIADKEIRKVKHEYAAICTGLFWYVSDPPVSADFASPDRSPSSGALVLDSQRYSRIRGSLVSISQQLDAAAEELRKATKLDSVLECKAKFMSGEFDFGQTYARGSLDRLQVIKAIVAGVSISVFELERAIEANAQAFTGPPWS